MKHGSLQQLKGSSMLIGRSPSNMENLILLRVGLAVWIV